MAKAGRARLTRDGLLVAAALAAQAGLLVWYALCHSPAVDEVAYLPAGLSHWAWGNFDLCRVNPPLVRLWAAAPLYAAGVEMPQVGYYEYPAARHEWTVGPAFLLHHGPQAFRYLMIARVMCLPLVTLGGWANYRWARELFGREAGFVALVLWVTSPFILGHGQFITSDVAGAALAATASYAYWRWLHTPTWSGAMATGLLLGLGQLTRTTLVLLVPIWLVLWIIAEFSLRRGTVRRERWSRAWQFAAVLLLALYVLNLGYAFVGSWMPLGKFRFASAALTGHPVDDAAPREGNRFADTWLGALPVPVPRDYLLGIDLQMLDFEKQSIGYLRGEWRIGGWWYYYLYGFTVKTPVGMLLLTVLAVVALTVRPRKPGWLIDQLSLLLPLIVILTMVSRQTGINEHVRYAITCLPFWFVWISQVAGAWPRSRLAHATILFLLAWTAAGSLAAAPHSMSYFNELVGGPKSGPAHLHGSSTDWGQDLLLFKRWYDAHPEARPIDLAYFPYHIVPPQLVGLTPSAPPSCPPLAKRGASAGDPSTWGPRPGWYAVSTNFLYADEHPRRWTMDGRDLPYLGYFLNFEPTARAGYSIYVYHLEQPEVNRVRVQLGLEPLDE